MIGTARRVGVSEHIARQVIYEHGLVNPGQLKAGFQRLDTTHDQRIKELYEMGIGLKRIAQEIGKDHIFVMVALKAMGIYRGAPKTPYNKGDGSITLIPRQVLRMELKKAIQPIVNEIYPIPRKPSKQKTFKDRYQSDICFRLTQLCRRRVRKLLSGVKKGRKTMELVGCNSIQLREHLQAQFRDGMAWNNIGKWHIDHIKPCALFDMRDENEQKKCFHYSNLQPLWAKDNLKKGAKYHEITAH